MVDKLEELFNKYHLDLNSKKELKNIIYPIYIHPEFQRRLTKEYLHHSDITLGEHILKDTIETYLLCQKKKNINLELALKISMFHDLYTSPWQNTSEKYKFFHKHGFRHPVEAVINAISWFPEYFTNKQDAQIIIDGILHHMYPLPVSSNKISIQNTEIKNYDLYLKLDHAFQEMILNSLQRKRFKDISFSKSLYIEGRIMSKADKKVALKEIKNVSSAKALLTGKNKRIKKGN